MAHEINYTTAYGDPQERERAALCDLVQWLGFKTSLIMFRHLKKWAGVVSEGRCSTPVSEICQSVRFQLSVLAGASGYPVTVLLQKFGFDDTGDPE